MTERLATELAHLRARRITFTQFYRATKEDWSCMATTLHKHWQLPPTVTVDDVEQELLLGGWMAVLGPKKGRWAPGRGMTLEGYVVWTAHSRTTKWIHKQRGCEQHRRKGPSQYAWCISAIARDADVGQRILENHADGRASSEDKVDYGDILRAIPTIATTEAGKVGLQHFIASGGDIEAAAKTWHANKDHRQLFELGRTPERAKKIIQGEIRSVRSALLCDGGDLS